MSIEIYAFLGANLHDLEARVIETFESLGFKVVFHPEMPLLQSNPSGCMNIAILEMLPTLERLAPGKPLLVEIGYSVGPAKPAESKWPPRKVKKHSLEVYTRTSAGRSRSSYFMQALSAAILAKTTDGYFWVNGDAEALSGNEAVEKVVGELEGIEKSAQQLEVLLGRIASDDKYGSDAFRASMQDRLETAFDVGAHPFKSWPDVAMYAQFRWAEPIRAPAPFVARTRPTRKISAYWVTVAVVVTTLVLVTVLFS